MTARCRQRGRDQPLGGPPLQGADVHTDHACRNPGRHEPPLRHRDRVHRMCARCSVPVVYARAYPCMSRSRAFARSVALVTAADTERLPRRGLITAHTAAVEIQGRLWWPCPIRGAACFRVADRVTREWVQDVLDMH